jgi:glycerol-3-phosphate O-acyltransferase
MSQKSRSQGGPGRYQPNAAIAWLYDRFFSNIEIDETWAESVRDADRRGVVIYALRNLSFVDFFALDYLTKRLDLPEIRFANDLGLSVLEPMGGGLRNAFARKTEEDQAELLAKTLAKDESAALFLKRPPSPFEGRRAQSEGDKLLATVIRAQKEKPTHPILVVPQVFVWSRSPDLLRGDAVDLLFGPREWPGKLRTIAQFLMNYRHVTLRAGEPIDVQRFIEREGDLPTDVLVRRLTYTLLRRLERERHAVLGPVKKPDDRLREEVLRSPKLRKVIADMAGEGDAERRAMGARAEEMLRKLEATQDINAMKVMEVAFDNTVKRMYSAFEIDHVGLERLRKISRDGTLVLLPSHKSHVDYIILTWAFYASKLPPPLIAAGDNLSFFPLGPILRRAGAFFIRRSFKGDRLYGAVVDAYVRRIIKDGFPIEFFLEGGRSRTGKLLSPKLGLLGMVVDGASGLEEKVHFCPISIGYERLVEEDSYVLELSGGEKKKEDVTSLAGTLEVALKRYGRLNIQFGEPVTLAGVISEMGLPKATIADLPPPKRRAVVTRLAHRVMNEINRVTAVTPGSLVATALLTHEHRGISHADLCDRVVMLAQVLRELGARFAPALSSPGEPGGIRQASIVEACESFVRDKRILAHNPGEPIALRPRGARGRAGDDAIYTVVPEARIALDLSKNLIVHFFLARGLFASALTPAYGGTPMPRDTLRERVQYLSRLFKFEFSFRADATFERIFEETLTELAARGEVVILGEGPHARVGVGPKEELLRLYGAVLLNFVEGYRVAARSLLLLAKTELAEKDLERRALSVGERMYHADEIARREAVSRPLFTNAYAAFVDQGYLTRGRGKLSLPESYATPEAVKTVEARIASYVSR